MRYRLWVCAVLSWLILQSASASALELNRLVQALETQYPPVQEARLKVEQARAKLLEKQGGFDSKFKGKLEGVPLGYYRQLRLESLVEQPTPWWGAVFFSAYRLGAGDFADYDGKKQTLSGGEFSIGARLPLLRNGPIDPIRAELVVLELQIALAELEVRAKQLEAAEKALKSYWAWAAAQEKTRVAKDLLRLAETRLSQIDKEIQAGKRATIERTENQRALLNRRAKLLETELKLQEKALELSLFVPSEVLETAPALPSPTVCQAVALESVYQRGLAQRPELLRLNLQREQNRIGLELAENQFLPALDLYFALSQDVGTGDKSRQPLELEGGLSWEWPVQQRKAEGQRRQLEAERAQIDIRENFAQALLRNQLQTAGLVRQVSCQSWRLAEAESLAARTLAEAEQRRFALGATDLFQVNLREQAWVDSQQRVVDALEAYAWAESQLQLGQGLLPQSVNDTTGPGNLQELRPE